MIKKIDVTSTAVEKGIDLVRDFVDQLVSPSSQELGLLLKDQISLWRFQNQVKILQKARKICETNNISPKSIKPKLLCPYLEQASLEDDDELQDKWATLLANMVDSKQNIESHVFPYILSQISKQEFNTLEQSYTSHVLGLNRAKRELEALSSKYDEAVEELKNEEAGLPNEQIEHRLSLRKVHLNEYIERSLIYCVSEFEEFELANVIRLGLVSVKYGSSARHQNLKIPTNEYYDDYVSVEFAVEIENDEEICITGLGLKFFKVCSSVSQTDTV